MTPSIQPTTSSNDLIINIAPNPLTSQASASTSLTSSPGKHPAITRVVCSNATNSIGSGSNLNNDNVRITSSQIKRGDTFITTTTTTAANTKFGQNEQRILISPVTSKRTTTIAVNPQLQQTLNFSSNNDVKSECF